MSTVPKHIETVLNELESIVVETATAKTEAEKADAYAALKDCRSRVNATIAAAIAAPPAGDTDTVLTRLYEYIDAKVHSHGMPQSKRWDAFAEAFRRRFP
jgi:hypothetical protein